MKATIISTVLRFFFKGILGVFILIFLEYSGLQAQERYSSWWQAGPIVKMTSSKMNINSDLIDLSATEAEVGYQLGAFARINVQNVFVQPQILIAKTSSQLVFKDYDGISGFNPRADFEFNTINLPIDIGFRFGGLRVFMGPSLSLLLSGERSFLNEVENTSEQFNRSNVLWHFGLGGDFNRFSFDVQFESGLSKTGESLSQLVGREFVPRQRQWVFSFALNLLNQY